MSIVKSTFKLAEYPVLVINWNGFEVTRPCLEALENQSIGVPTIFLLDNGSEKKDFKALNEFCASRKHIRLYENKTNEGFAKGCNFLIEEVKKHVKKAKGVVLLNNDTIVDKYWLDELLKTQQCQNWDMVSSAQVFHTYPDTIDNLGLMLLSTSEVLPVGAREEISQYKKDQTNLCPSAGAGFYNLAIFEKVGQFDPYFNNCFEDAELGLRARLAGFTSGYSIKAIVKHRVSYSVKRTKRSDYGIELQKNMLFTYFSLMPIGVKLLFFPLIFIRTIALIFLGLFTFRFKLVQTQLVGWGRFLKDISKTKTNNQVLMPFSELFALHQPFFLVYIKYLKQFIFNPKPTVLE